MARLSFLGLLAVLVLSSLAFAQTPAADDEAIKKATEPIVDNILTALQAKDYVRMGRDFSETMQKALPKEELEIFNKKILERDSGAYVSKTFNRIEKKDGFILVFYWAKFTKEDKVIVQGTFKECDPKWKVEGLFFRPSATAVRPENAEAEAIRKLYEPVTNNYFEGLKAKDYQRMTKDFAKEMLEALSADKLKQTYETDINRNYGEFADAKFDRVDKDKKFVIVYYIARHGEKNFVQVTFAFRNDDPEHKLFGLWTKPL